ncbi:MAG: c-type cytochrome, partial [Myxococcales bacterium]|nr:c-type cytochrome [Myxococcales bacterium]
ECHGKDFGGGTMVDGPAIGRMLGPNLTEGEGSVTLGYTMADWDRIVRHGIRRDGKPAVMPSEDFLYMSDRELSDIVAYVRSVPAVDGSVDERSLGPLGAFLMAMGEFKLSCDNEHLDHGAAHEMEPPDEAPDATYGKHIAQVCSGCHRSGFEGGPIPAGPPDWAPAANLTPHEDGLAGWTYEDFTTALQEGKRKDGTPFAKPMDLIPPYAQQMTEVELQALWAFLQSLEAKPDPS